MNVLLTGSTGFLGGHILRKLYAQDNHFICLVRPTSKIEQLQKLCPNIRWVDSIDELLSLDKQWMPNAIIHTATDYGRDHNKERVWHVNVDLPFQLLKFAVEHQVKHFINIDSFSSKIEGYPYLPEYHASKNAFLEQSAQFASEDMLFATLRLFHLYGTHDNLKKFIPFLIHSFVNEVPDLDLTAGEQMRDFVYAEDVVDAISILLESTLRGNKEFEVGTGVMTSVKDMVLAIKTISLNTNTELKFGALPTRKNEVMASKANNEALLKLGWRPKFNLEAGLEKTVHFYRNKMS